jgi:carbon monoxide dehydrogenase subunit G
MTQLGADPDHLRDLARTLRSAAGQLDTLSTGLARRARTAGWRGPDADAFERRWQVEHRPRMQFVAEQLGSLSRQAERHADEQVHASGGIGATASTAAHSPTPVARATTPMSALPRQEDRYSGGVDLRVGPVVGTLTGDLTLQQLDGERVRVIFARAVGAGAAVGAGTTADLAVGGPNGAGAAGSGASGDARLRLAGIERRAWEVDRDRVDDLLVRLALEQGATATTGHADPLGVLAGGLDQVAERLLGRDPGLDLAAALATSLPIPARTDVLAEVEVAGAAGIGLGAVAGLGARVSGVSSLRAGTSTTAAGRANVVEYHGSSTGALTSTLLRRLGIQLPTDAHRALTVRLEHAPVAGADGSQLLVRVSATTDARIDDVIARVTLSDASDPASTAVTDTLGALGRGDVSTALAAIQHVDIPVERVELIGGQGELTGRSGRAGVGAGLGIGAGISARGAATHVDRRG